MFLKRPGRKGRIIQIYRILFASLAPIIFKTKNLTSISHCFCGGSHAKWADPRSGQPGVIREPSLWTRARHVFWIFVQHFPLFCREKNGRSRASAKTDQTTQKIAIVRSTSAIANWKSRALSTAAKAKRPDWRSRIG